MKELEASTPGSLKKAIRLIEKKGGQEITNVVEFNPSMELPTFTNEKAEELEWKIFKDMGGMKAKTNKFIVNPYKFIKSQFTCLVDPEVIISRSMGTDSAKKMRAFELLADPRVQPYVNMEEVVDKFILQEYTDGDIDKFKRKPEDNMANAMMGGMPQGPIQPTSAIPNPAIV